MRVVLVRPAVPNDAPLPKTPADVHIGLASLAATLEKNGIDVAVIDNALLKKNNADLLEQIKHLCPDLVGINCDLVTISAVAQLTQVLRHIPLPVVIGGPEVNIHPQETFLRINPDFCIYGEGEHALLELCAHLERTGKNLEMPTTINGLVLRNTQGNIIQTEKRPLIQNLDTLPFLALHKFPLEKYRRKDRFLNAWPVDSLITSRGCPYRCAFCSNETIWGKQYRAMTSQRIIDEIEYMMKRYGTRAVYFKDDNFTLDKQRIYSLCNELIKKRLGIRWVCESRVDAVDDALLKLMKSAGCESIWFGVESGVPRVLDMLHKDITIEEIEHGFALCKKHGITTGASIMLGIPGETKREAWETVRFTRRLNPSVVLVNIFLGIPGSEIYDTIISERLPYKRYEGLILPYTRDMTWQQKQRFVFIVKLIFTLRPSEIKREIKERGISHYLKEKLVNAARLLKNKNFSYYGV